MNKKARALVETAVKLPGMRKEAELALASDLLNRAGAMATPEFKAGFLDQMEKLAGKGPAVVKSVKAVKSKATAAVQKLKGKLPKCPTCGTPGRHGWVDVPEGSWGCKTCGTV